MKFVIDYEGQRERHDKHWQFCVGSCHAPLAQRADYLKQLKFIHDELGIERVRFHGLFNDDMDVGLSMRRFVPLPSAKKYKEISFYQVGRVFDNILSTGMKPFVELGFMPSVLASGKRQCSFKYRGNITMPKDLKEWSDFIAGFVNFLIDRYGREEVESWYFEVWNEPNLPVFFAGSKEDYFNLYAATARAVKSVDQNIRVGGPSTASCAWVDDFVAYCEKNSLPFDFISTHQYAGEKLGHSMKVAKMLPELLKRIRNLRKGSGTVLEGTRILFTDETEVKEIERGLFGHNTKQLCEKTLGRPLLMTEWNVSATCSAPINDSIRAASYAVKTVLDSEGYVAGSSFWCFSDLFEELTLFPYPFSGNFGLLTIDGIPKPSFYGFKLMSMLGGERYTLPRTNEPIECAAFRKERDLQLLLYRQDFKQRALPDENIVFEINCADSPKSVSIIKIDSVHGNPIAVWVEMGRPQYLKQAQIDEIVERSALSEQPIGFEYNDGRLIIENKIGVNEVGLITVKF